MNERVNSIMQSPSTPGASLRREFYVDWLRVFATALVLLFHCARFFDPERWHVKNADHSRVLGVFVGFLVQWMMPLFFILSAISIRHALARRDNRQYLVERLQRLGVPFIFGTLVLIPPQVYIERTTQGGFRGSFFAFLPHYFEGWYGFGGNFAWMGLHLWYLEVLLVLSLLTLPLFRWLASPTMAAKFEAVAMVLTRPGRIFLLAVPVAAMEMLVNLQPGGIGRRDFGGWSVFTYTVFFLLGYFIGSDARLRSAFERHRLGALLTGIVASSGLYVLTTSGHSDRWWPLALLRAVNSWAWLVAILGVASKHFDHDSSFLRRANEAVLPFYVLHQTVIVVIAFGFLGWQAGILVKYLALVAASLVIILGIYTCLIRPWRVMRCLFGMRSMRSNKDSRPAGVNLHWLCP